MADVMIFIALVGFQLQYEPLAPRPAIRATAGGKSGIGIDWLTPVLRGPLCDSGNIESLCVNPKLPLIVAAGRKGRSSDGMKFYDARSGAVLFATTEAGAPCGEFLSVACSPSGEVVAASTRAGAVILWEVRMPPNDGAQISVREKCRLTLPEPKGAARSGLCATCLSFSPHNDVLAVGCDDHVVRLYSLPRNELQATLTGHTGGISAVAFSPDGTLLASGGGSDGTTRIWDMRRFSFVFSLARGTAVVTDLVFAADGKLLVAAYGSGMPGYPDSSIVMEYPEEQLRFWDVSTGRVQRCLFVGGERANSVSLACADGSVAAGYTHREASTDNSVAILDLVSGQRVGTITGRWVAPIARWLPSSRVLVTIAGPHVAAWDTQEAGNSRQLWTDTWHWLDKPIHVAP
jgi:WD40 repeat protein